MSAPKMDRITAATVAAVAKVFEEAVIKPQKEPARAVLTAHMLAEEIDKFGVRLPGAASGRIADVRLAPGRVTAKITDRVKFVAWVKEHHPRWIEEAVRKDDEDRLTNAMAKLGEPIDAATGEVVPGVEIGEGAPYVVVTPTEEAPRLVFDAIRAGELKALALPGGES